MLTPVRQNSTLTQWNAFSSSQSAKNDNTMQQSNRFTSTIRLINSTTDICCVFLAFVKVEGRVPAWKKWNHNLKNRYWNVRPLKKRGWETDWFSQFCLKISRKSRLRPGQPAVGKSSIKSLFFDRFNTLIMLTFGDLLRVDFGRALTLLKFGFE